MTFIWIVLIVVTCPIWLPVLGMLSITLSFVVFQFFGTKLDVKWNDVLVGHFRWFKFHRYEK